MPENTVYVGRPTKWGNPFTELEGLNAKGRVSAYRDLMAFRLEFVSDEWNLGELRGKNLACWCPLDQPCHADVLLELANKDSENNMEEI